MQIFSVRDGGWGWVKGACWAVDGALTAHLDLRWRSLHGSMGKAVGLEKLVGSFYCPRQTLLSSSLFPRAAPLN